MEIKGDSVGSQDAESYFLAKIVTMSDDENLFYDVEMVSPLNGKLTLGNYKEYCLISDPIMIKITYFRCKK